MSSDRDFPPEHLAQVDQWHASVVNHLDELLDQIRGDIASDADASQAVDTWLLARGLDRGASSRAGLADLLAALLIRTHRGAA